GILMVAGAMAALGGKTVTAAPTSPSPTHVIVDNAPLNVSGAVAVTSGEVAITNTPSVAIVGTVPVNVGNSPSNPLYVTTVDYAAAFMVVAHWSIPPGDNTAQPFFNPVIPTDKRMIIEHISVHSYLSPELATAPIISVFTVPAWVLPRPDLVGTFIGADGIG